jgi:hypothetical protein
MKHLRLNEELSNLISKKMRRAKRIFIVVCSMAYLSCNFHLVYAQSTQQGEKQEQVLSVLEQKMITFLSTVKGKQEETQLQIQTLELELKNHQEKKKKKKNKAADELVEQTLQKEIAALSAKMNQYKKLEDEAATFLSTLKEKQEYVQTHPEWKPNTSAVAKNQPSRQGQPVASSEREKQIQEVMQKINDLTEEINRRKQQASQTAPSSERERRIQELEKNAVALNEQIKAYTQNQQRASSTSGQTGQNLAATEKEKRIQEVLQRIAELTEEINRRKQASQVTYSPEREKRIQELEKETATLNEQAKVQSQTQQKPAYVAGQTQTQTQTRQLTAGEKEKQIQEVMQKISDLTAEISKQKQANQVAYSPERSKRIQELEREAAALNEQIKVQTQSQQKPAFITGQTQTGLTATTKEKQLQDATQKVNDLTVEINKQKQANQVAYSPERARRIQEMEREAATLNEQIKVQPQTQQTQTGQVAMTEKEKQIQEVMQKINDLTEEINRRKQAAGTGQKQTEQVAATSDKNKPTQETGKGGAVSNQQTQQTQIASSEKDKKIKDLETMVANLNSQVKTYTQNQQRQTSVYEQKQTELAATISAKDRRIQELEKSLALLNAQTNKGYTTQKQGTTTTTTQSTTPRRSTASTTRNQPLIYQGNVSSGYYIIFGSFIERNNAERFLTKLTKRYVNVIDLGNDNVFGMYRTGIGPYKTKEEALANRPTDARNWILRVETVPNTKLIAYFEILEE